MQEEWKAVPGFEEWYEVSNMGRIRSYNKFGHGRRKEPVVINPTKDCYGYLQLTLCKCAVHKQAKVHLIVAEAFLPPKECGMQVDHKNGIKTDNRVENLEWVTPKENTVRSVALGLKPKGERHWKHKLTQSDVDRIRELYKTGMYSQRKLGEMYGVSHCNIGDIVNYRIWRVKDDTMRKSVAIPDGKQVNNTV